MQKVFKSFSEFRAAVQFEFYLAPLAFACLVWGLPFEFWGYEQPMIPFLLGIVLPVLLLAGFNYLYLIRAKAVSNSPYSMLVVAGMTLGAGLLTGILHIGLYLLFAVISNLFAPGQDYSYVAITNLLYIIVIPVVATLLTYRFYRAEFKKRQLKNLQNFLVMLIAFVSILFLLAVFRGLYMKSVYGANAESTIFNMVVFGQDWLGPLN